MRSTWLFHTFLLLETIVIGGSAAAVDEVSKAPDAVYINGNIYTQAQAARAEAIAVANGRIVAVGSNAEITKLKGAKTQVVDLGGHFVMPGFNDAHTHLASGGFEKMNVNLVGTKSLQEMQQRIAERAAKVAANEWIIGEGWDHTLWPGQALPTRQDLDAVTSGHPAIFVRVDGHIAIANTAALKAGGVTGSTQAPQGGKIDLDVQGQPTGILREGAQSLVFSKVPAPTATQRRQAAE